MKKLIHPFSPAYFALVMSTGIISLAAAELGLPVVADGLFHVNLVAYPLFLLLLVLRLLLDFSGCWAERTPMLKGRSGWPLCRLPGCWAVCLGRCDTARPWVLRSG